MELLAVIPLLAVFAAIAFPLVRGAVRSMAAASAAATAGGRVDAAVAAVRADVWGAGTAVAGLPHELTLTPAGGGPVVTWHLGADGAVRRSAGGERRWAGVWPDATVTVGPTAVTVDVSSKGNFRGGPVVLARAAAMLGGGDQ